MNLIVSFTLRIVDVYKISMTIQVTGPSLKLSLSRSLSHLGPAQVDKQMTRANSLDGGDLYFIQLLNEFVLRMTE